MTLDPLITFDLSLGIIVGLRIFRFQSRYSKEEIVDLRIYEISV